jgi:hypothetical protein
MANIIKLGSLFLDGRPVETGMQYVPSQTIEVGEMTPSKEIGWVAVNGLLIADQCLLTNVSWDDLDVQGLVFGKEVTVQGLRFKIRLLKVGSKEDVPNEWDAALDAVGEDDTLWHWDHKFFWGQEPVSGSVSHRAIRGYTSARHWGWSDSSSRHALLGFRPALEPLPTDPSAIRHSQEALVIGRAGAVAGSLIDATAYDLVIQPNADGLIGEVSFAAKMQDGTLAVDRSGIISIAT